VVLHITCAPPTLLKVAENDVFFFPLVTVLRHYIDLKCRVALETCNSGSFCWQVLLRNVCEEGEGGKSIP
jgi:hypothetical protein